MSWDCFQTLILLGTAVVVAWYTWETHRTRKEMVRQTELGQTPHVMAWCRRHQDVYIVNTGNGPAIDFRVKLVGFDVSTGRIIKEEISVLDLHESAKPGFDKDGARLIPYIFPQATEDGPTVAVMQPPDDDAREEAPLLEGVNAIWVTYQDTFGRKHSKIIEFDKHGDYMGQQDYTAPK